MMGVSIKSLMILSFLLMLTYCSVKEPIPEDILILVYAELMFAQDTLLITKQNVDSLKSQVFERHNILDQDYQNTIEIYTNTPERWDRFFDRVMEYIESLKTKPVKQESVSFWPLRFVKEQN